MDVLFKKLWFGTKKLYKLFRLVDFITHVTNEIKNVTKKEEIKMVSKNKK